MKTKLAKRSPHFYIFGFSVLNNDNEFIVWFDFYLYTCRISFIKPKKNGYGHDHAQYN